VINNVLKKSYALLYSVSQPERLQSDYYPVTLVSHTQGIRYSVTRSVN